MKIKKWRLVLIAICLSICSCVHANLLSDFTVAVEWLYMLPSINQPYFIISRIPVGPVEFEEKRFHNHQHWHSGYRAELIYTFNHCLNDFRVRWTHFPTFTESRTINGDVLIAVITIPAFVFPQFFNQSTKSDTFDFHYLDLLIGQTLMNSPRFKFDFQWGIQYGYLKLMENIVYIGNDEEMVNDLFNSCFQGIGFEVGSQLAYRLAHCLHIQTRGYISLLISEIKAKRKRVIFQNGFLTGLGNLKNENYWNVVPAASARLGLIYSYPWSSEYSSSFTFSLESGYEIIAFFQGIDRIFFTSPQPPQSGSIDQLMNFTAHGPYLRLEVCY